MAAQLCFLSQNSITNIFHELIKETLTKLQSLIMRMSRNNDPKQKKIINRKCTYQYARKPDKIKYDTVVKYNFNRLDINNVKSR